MSIPPNIPPLEGEKIIWQGRAAFPGHKTAEYIPLFITLLLFLNSCWLLYPVEPLIMLHNFCADGFLSGLLILFTVAFAVAPTLKRKLIGRQLYVFTNLRAVCYDAATGRIIHTLPADNIPDCIIKHHGEKLISILQIDHSGHERSTVLLFAHIPAEILSHYTSKA